MDVDAIENILIEYCDKFDIDLENFCPEQIEQSDNRRDACVDYFIRIIEACCP